MGEHERVDDTAAAEALAKKVFYAHLISPLADWALAEVARKAVTSPLALGTSYELVQLEEASTDRLADSLKKTYA